MRSLCFTWCFSFNSKVACFGMLLLCVIGCQSTEDESPADLDIVQPKIKTEEELKAEYEKEQITAVQQGSALLNWQIYFMKPPSEMMRKKITERLDGLNQNSSKEDFLTKAKLEISVGRWEAAEASLRTVLRLDSTNTEALLELTNVYLKNKQISRSFETLKTLKQNISSYPKPDAMMLVRYRYLLSLALISNQERKEGHTILTNILETHADFLPAYSALASSYLALGHIDLADFVIKRGLSKFEKDPSLLSLHGLILSQKQKYSEARSAYNTALEVNPDHVGALVNRASLSCLQNECTAGELDAEKALKLEPNNANIHQLLGEIYLQSSRIQLAQNSFQTAIRLNPELAVSRFKLGLIMKQFRNEASEALRYFSEIQQLPNADEALKQEAKLQIYQIKEATP